MSTKSPADGPIKVVKEDYDIKIYPDGSSRRRGSREEIIFPGGNQPSTQEQPSIDNGSNKK